jgi:hypothetical protein
MAEASWFGNRMCLIIDPSLAICPMPVALSVSISIPRVRRVKLQPSGTKNTLDNIGIGWFNPCPLPNLSRWDRFHPVSLPSYANGETCWATSASNTGRAKFVAWEKATCGHRHCAPDAQQTLRMISLYIHIYIKSYIYIIYIYIDLIIYLFIYLIIYLIFFFLYLFIYYCLPVSGETGTPKFSALLTASPCLPILDLGNYHTPQT